MASSLRRLADLQLAFVAVAAANAGAGAGGAAGSGAGGASGGGGDDDSGASPPAAQAQAEAQADLGRHKALELAQQAYTIAHRALTASRQHVPVQTSSGLWAWLPWSRPQLSTQPRPLRPEVATLEVAACLRTLSRAHEAVQQGDKAMADLEQAITLLGQGFPTAAKVGLAGQAQEEAQQQQQQQKKGEADAAGGQEAVGGTGPEAAVAEAGGDSGGEEEGPGGEAPVPLRQAARAARLEQTRMDALCGALGDLLAVLGRQGRGSEGKRLRKLEQRMQQEGCITQR